MALVSRIRTRRVRQVSSAAEACETRSLLCAAAISLAAAEFQDASDVVASEEITSKKMASEDEVLVGEDQLIELTDLQDGMMTCWTMLPSNEATGEFVEGTIVEDAGTTKDGWDPSWAYETLLGGTGNDGTEGEVIDPAVCFAGLDGFVLDNGELVDGSDVEGINEVRADWDPVWAYRILLGSTGEDGAESEVIDPAVCDATADGFVTDVFESFGGSASDDIDATQEGWDPSWVFRTLSVSTGDGGVEGELIDPAVCYAAPDGFVPDGGKMVDSDGDGIIDLEVVRDEAWDPSWLYREAIEDGVTVVEPGVVEEELVDSDGNGIPDALDCGIKEGDVVANGDYVDSDGDGEPDSFVMYVIDPVAKETLIDVDADGNPIEVAIDPVRYLGGPEFRGAVENDSKGDGEELPVDVTMSPDDQVVELEGDFTGDGSGVIDAVTDNSELPPEVIFYSMNSVGGGDLQRTPESVETPVPVNSVPASVSSSLFQPVADLSFAGTLIAGAEASSVQTVVLKSLSSSPARSKSISLSAATPTNSGKELEGLSPLLEGADDTAPAPVSEGSATETAVDEESVSVSDQQETVEARMTSARMRNNESAPEVAQRSRRAVKIDEFMTEFAQDSFMG